MEYFTEIADAINTDINKILNSALNGNLNYRSDDGSIKWDFVQKKINSVVDYNLTVCSVQYQNVARFLKLLPDDHVKPCSTLEDDLNVMLDFDFENLSSLSVSIGKSDKIAYAWTSGMYSGHGVDTFENNCSAILLKYYLIKNDVA